MIDIETCEYTREYTNPFDPYYTDPWDDVPPDAQAIGAVSINVGSSGATKATAGSRWMIYRKRSGKR